MYVLLFHQSAIKQKLYTLYHNARTRFRRLQISATYKIVGFVVAGVGFNGWVSKYIVWCRRVPARIILLYILSLITVQQTHHRNAQVYYQILERQYNTIMYIGHIFTADCTRTCSPRRLNKK